MCFSKQLWNAFHDSTGNFPQASLQNLLQESKPLVPTHNPPTSGDIHLFKNSEVMLLHCSFEILGCVFHLLKQQQFLLFTLIIFHNTTLLKDVFL